MGAETSCKSVLYSWIRLRLWRKFAL